MSIRVPFVAAVALAAAVSMSAAHADSAGWQPPDSLAGLVGSYTRPPLTPGPIAFVTLDGSDGYRAQGPYTRFFDVGGGRLELQEGDYSAIANNPAVGAFILFFDAAGNVRDAFPIIGIKRDPLGKRVVALELLEAYGGTTFVLMRVGL